jgi:hypothetical protein
MSLTTIIPILVALAAAVFGAIVYVFQKAIDRKNALIELRRKTYQDFIDSFYDTSFHGTKESLSHFNKCAARLVIIGSDEVTKKVGIWRKYMEDTSPNSAHTRDTKLSKRLMAEFIISMRRDCFEKSDLGIEQVYAMIPIQD